MEEVIKPGSVTKRPGHLFIRKHSLRFFWGSRSVYVLNSQLSCHEKISDMLRYSYNNTYKFHHVFGNGHTYYVDGHGQVWETDINLLANVIFNPVCVEKVNNLLYRTIMFKKLTKLECLFL